MDIDIASLGRALLFLGVPMLLVVFYLQFRWAKICDTHILVLIAEKGGGGRYQLAPKQGGEVTIYNPMIDEQRTWPVNELATIDVTYPGVGFVPKALQKSIRLAVVNEGDWEPMLNRSPHRRKVASPDVVEYLVDLAARNPRTKEEILAYTREISTSPTREMIADPATLGSLLRNSVMKALASVSNDLLERLKIIEARLSKVAGGINPMIAYIMLGLIVILQCFLVYQLMQVVPLLEQAGDLAVKMDAIYNALGLR